MMSRFLIGCALLTRFTTGRKQPVMIIDDWNSPTALTPLTMRLLSAFLTIQSARFSIKNQVRSSARKTGSPRYIKP